MRILAPFRVRDFALYWSARTISQLGDGVMVVALPWQVYELTDSPSAMGVVGAIQTASIFLFVLVGGAVSDRMERKRVLIAADVARGLAGGAAGVLALSGRLELWHLGVVMVVFGIGQGFSGPARGAILPQLVPEELLVQANSALFTVSSLTTRFLGPALGGVVIAAAGAGAAFVVDGASFFVAALTVLFLTARPVARLLDEGERRTIVQDIREGVGYVRNRVWLWGTLTWMFIAFPFTTAPYGVLLPYLVKHELGGGSRSLGLIFAAGGVSAIVTSLAVSQVRLPRSHTAFMYAMLGFGVFDLVAYSVAQAPWHAMAIAFVAEACLTSGVIVWNTLLQRAVPAEMLGRVRGLEWLAAYGLTPLGYVVVGQLADVIGARAVMASFGLAGVVLTAAVYRLPGMRETEGEIRLSTM